MTHVQDRIGYDCFEELKHRTDKTIFILFSGGADSTALVGWYLDEGYTLDLSYGPVGQHPLKLVAEYKRRKEYLDRQEKKNFKDHTPDLMELLKENHRIMQQRATPVFNQLPRHLDNIRCNLDCVRTGAVAMGSVLNDDDSFMWQTLVNTWEGISRISFGKEIPLFYPLGTTTKDRVYQQLIHTDMLKHTWVCELPKCTNDDVQMKITPCMECHACRWRKETLIELKHPIDELPVIVDLEELTPDVRDMYCKGFDPIKKREKVLLFKQAEKLMSGLVDLGERAVLISAMKDRKLRLEVTQSLNDLFYQIAIEVGSDKITTIFNSQGRFIPTNYKYVLGCARAFLDKMSPPPQNSTPKIEVIKD